MDHLGPVKWSIFFKLFTVLTITIVPLAYIFSDTIPFLNISSLPILLVVYQLGNFSQNNLHNYKIVSISKMVFKMECSVPRSHACKQSIH